MGAGASAAPQNIVTGVKNSDGCPTETPASLPQCPQSPPWSGCPLSPQGHQALPEDLPPLYGLPPSEQPLSPLSPLTPAKVMRRVKRLSKSISDPWLQRPDLVVVRLPRKPSLDGTPHPIVQGSLDHDPLAQMFTRQLSPVSACWRSSSKRIASKKSAELARQEKIVKGLAGTATAMIHSNPRVAAGLAMIAADVAESMPAGREESKSLTAWEGTEASNRLAPFASKALVAARKGSFQAEEMIESAICSAVTVATARKMGVNVKRI